jgi:hypothetical protein
MSTKARIARDIGGTQLIDDINHFRRRFFRCWLDGSYHGVDTYRANIEFITNNRGNEKVMRSWIINQFVNYIARDYACSPTTAHKAILTSIDRETLEALNKELIIDALDMAEQ